MLASVAEKIAETDEQLLAFVPEDDRAGRLAAAEEELALRWPEPAERPALYGVPVGVKDVFRTAELPTLAGSALPAEVFTGPEAVAVTRLKAAGAVVAGKTVTAEFAFFAPGPTRNPHHPQHTPGGSSSGSAAAVGAGLVPLALGTQTVASIVRPAAFCGCLGFKPSYGRVPTDGVVANAPTFDTVGLFAADLTLAATAAEALCDDWNRDVPAAEVVLGVPTGGYLEQVEPGAFGAFTTQLTALREAGYRLREVPLDDIEEINHRQRVVNIAELAKVHAAWFAEHEQRYRPQSAAAIREGGTIDAADYGKALAGVLEFRHRMPERMHDAGVDLWICPSATGPAPRGLDTTGNPTMSVPWTQAGCPSLSLPAGTLARAGEPALPIGLQLVGAPGADEHLLTWAAGCTQPF